MRATDTQWSEVLARKVLRTLLPPETSSTRSWEWASAEQAVKPLASEVRRLRVPLRVRERIEYDAEGAIRTALADTKAHKALEAGIARLALDDLHRSVPRKKIEDELARSAKKRVNAWLTTRLAIGVERARKEIARGERETRALLSSIGKMDPRALHRFANRWNWDDGVFAVDAVVRQPRCALGTALLVYSLAKPYWYAQWRSASRSDDPEAFAMLVHIEARIANGGYAHAGIAFDPRKENLTGDTYDEERKNRALPAQVFVATTKAGVVRFGPARTSSAR